MAARVVTLAFSGVEAVRVDVQVQFTGGESKFFLVGMGDKAVSESRERVRAAFVGMGLALPAKRIIANLAPADLPKEGSHYDLPIALAIMAAMGIIPPDVLEDWAAVGELALDGRITAITGALPAAVAAGAMGLGLICPEACGPEAAWAGETRILAAHSLIALVNHFRGTQILSPPQPGSLLDGERVPDLRDVKGQENAKRALEIAAAGGHNLSFIGPPGSGKSMMAARLPGLLPPLTPEELLQTSMIHSVAGLIARGQLTRARPFRSPHHSASMAALTGGGHKAKPGEVSLAHNGVLFLDELPEFPRAALEALREPLESGHIRISRAARQTEFPARFQLVAAMNPCPCGFLGHPTRACRCTPDQVSRYQAKLSGPLLDRIDLHVEVPALPPENLFTHQPGESSASVRERVIAARDRAQSRQGSANQTLAGRALDEHTNADAAALKFLNTAAARLGWSARGSHRALRVARTIADLEGGGPVRRVHIAEALIYRRVAPGASAGSVVSAS